MLLSFSSWKFEKENGKKINESRMKAMGVKCEKKNFSAHDAFNYVSIIPHVSIFMPQNHIY